MRIVVTGGSGFIGSNLVEYFSTRGAQVLNLDILPPRNPAHEPFWKNVDLVNAVALRDSLHEFQPEVIFHMAARTDLDGKELSDYLANTQGVENLIQAIREIGSLRSVIFASSRLVCRIGYQPVDEFDYCPSTVYGESKVIGERLVREAANNINCSWMIVRPTSIWGPWFDIPYKTFFLAIARGHYVHPGHAKIPKSFGFVGNTVHQLKCLMDAPLNQVTGRTFYLADYPPIDVLEMAHAIQRAEGARPIRSVPIPILRVAAMIGDIAKKIGYPNPPLTSFRLANLLTPMVHDLEALEEIAGKLPYEMEEGIYITVEWLRSRGEVF